MVLKRTAKKFAKNTKLILHAYNILKPIFHKNLEMDLLEARKILEVESFKPNGTCYCKNLICEPKVDLQIVIPVYNVEKFIEACLESVLSQVTSFTFKVIVVVDGATDQTSEIVNKYEGSQCFQIIHQDNRGISGARNTALNRIEGKYIMFLDSDDLLTPNAIDRLLTCALSIDADIVEGSYYSFHESSIIAEHIHEANDNLDSVVGRLRGFPWGKVVRSSLFQNLKFPEGYWFEDTIFQYLVHSRCKKAATIQEIVYGYRRNPNGITANAARQKKCIDTYWITETMLESLSLFEVEKTQALYEQTLRQIQLNYCRTRKINKQARRSIFALSVNMIKTEFCGFTTEMMQYGNLEKALRKNDYGAYVLNCEMIGYFNYIK